ncbi:MAG: LamG-like jellyroll fold domain-containing protein, partial [Saprospiraceae bacterium]
MKKYLRLYIAVAFLLGAVGILRSQGVRYIRIAQNSSGASDFLHLAEIRAIQSGIGNNVALGKAVTTDSEGTSLAKINYVDGNTSTSGGSAVAGKAGFVEIDLGATFVLSQVEIVNRFSSSSNVAIRARNLQLTLKNGNGEVVWSSAIDAYQGQNAALTTYWRQFESPPAFQITQACPTASSARLSFRNSAAGNALRFTGVPGQSVSVPSTLPIGDKDFTVEMWVKVPVVGQGGLTASEPVGRLMSTRTSGENTNWAINASGRLSMEWGLATITGTTDLRDGKWHHLLFSRDKTANTYKGFLDGNLELSAASAGSDVTFEADGLRIGTAVSTGGDVFHGLIDELRVWKVRKEDIPNHNPNREVQPTSQLELYYRFNENNSLNTTSIVYDYSLNGRHGVLSDSLLAIDSRVSDTPAPISWASALWSTGSTDTSIVASQSGKYWATVSSGSGMVAVDTFTLQLPAIKQEISCGSAVLLAVGGETYAWAGGSTQPDTTVTANGTYTVSITSASCGTVAVSTQVTLPESSRYFRDSDGDSYGNPLIFQDACTKPAGFVSNAVDCDDGVATVYPGATERCDGLDNDCDGSIDEGLVIPTYYRDADGDGLGDPAFVVKSCMRPSGYVTTGTDCDDTNASIGTSPTLSTFYRDADGDGYGAASIQSCAQPIGYVTASGDCDDTNPRIHPGAPEICDNIDDNCNGILTEEACPGLTTDVSGNCTTISSVNVLQGESFFNYGSASNAINTSLRGNFTIGQPLVGTYNGQTATGAFGFWGRFLLAPSAPAIRATEGDLPDRIQVTWKPDPLSPVASGFKLYRNGALLASVDGDSRSFIDFNVIAGQFYTYEVAGVNSFGEGYKGKALGFLNPNGVVTGRITTFSGNSVPGTVVTLSPTIGKSLSFNQLASSFVENSSAFPNKGNFTVSCWVKIGNNNNSAAIFDLGSHLGKNWWLHTQRSGEAKGIAFGLGRTQGDTTVVRYTFPAATANAWHNVVATYNGASLLLYVDGELVETVVATYQSFQSVLFLGQKPTGGGNFNGQLDELRFFNRQLAQTEIQRYMNQSISSNTPGLTAYWKFDEGVGSRAYDLTANKLIAYHCGTQWSDDKPEVVNAAVSDKNGAYEIEGVNYGAGATFTASPSKDFHFNQSLEFNAANNQYANLTPFALSDSTTITVTVKPFDFLRKQTILSKASATGTNQFSIFIENGILKISSGSTAQSFSTLDMGFHNLTFVLRKDGSSLRVQLYKNGEIAGTQIIPAPSSWTGLPWKLGAAANGATGHKEYFTGLIDEVAFFKGLLPLNKIQEYANIGTSVTDQTLTSYFNLNEGSDTTIHDMGTALTGKGTLKGASWSTVAAIIRTEPHEFTPAARLVTLNPSNTSVDQVDFIDQSTIVVSGYVRFENTDCFQAKVEILVNGRSYVPQIFTDAEGKFTADFEPGAKVVLTPKFENHTFYPAFWEIPSLSTPVSGILFRNQIKRKVVGQVAGGLCRKSVIPDGAIAKVKVATLNGCYEQVIQLPANGKFIFNGVPPDSVTVSVIEHSNPVIYTFYQNKGGEVLDLKMEDDTVDFIYLAPPNVELTPIETNECGVPMLNMLQKTKTTIKVFEQYTGGKCYLDTALITINNDIAHLDQFDTLMTAGSLVHSYRVEEPNIVAPYLKYLQVTAEAHDEQATASLSAVVLGRRPRQTTFTSTSPGIPILILRDPPGDASYSFVESGETTCQTWGVSVSDTKDGETYVVASLGPDIETEMGTPFFATSLQIDVTADLGLSLSGSTTSYSSSEMETCITATRTISTSESDFVVGSEMGGDVYVGGAINFLYGITDELIYDTTNCRFLLDKGLFVFPQGFATTFVYSEYFITNNVIPALTLIGDTASIKSWQDILSLNRRLKKEAVFAKNLSFDAGAVYEESETTEVSKTITTEWTQGFSAGFSSEFGATVNGFGLVAGVSMNFSREETKTVSNTTASSRTVGYVLSDDDPGDNITVNVKK